MSADIDAILFDLDSTLTDRSASILKYSHLFHEHFESRLTPTSPAEIAAMIEELDLNGYAPRQQVFDGIMRVSLWSSIRDVGEIEEHWRRLFSGCAVGRQELHQTMAELVARGYRLGVVTNGRSLPQRAKIETLGIEKYLDTVVISKEVGFAKPESAIFFRALQDLRIEASRCLFVGDHPINDVSGASRAGLMSIWLEGAFAWPAALPPPQKKISALGDLLQLAEIRH